MFEIKKDGTVLLDTLTLKGGEHIICSGLDDYEFTLVEGTRTLRRKEPLGMGGNKYEVAVGINPEWTGIIMLLTGVETEEQACMACIKWYDTFGKNLEDVVFLTDKTGKRIGFQGRIQGCVIKGGYNLEGNNIGQIQFFMADEEMLFEDSHREGEEI